MVIHINIWFLSHSVSNSGTDYAGVQYNTSQCIGYTLQLYNIYYVWKFYRWFTDDENFDNNDISLDRQ